MTKLSLSNGANLNNPTSFLAQQAANNSAIIAAVENTLSRDGSPPNQMGFDLDMNGFRVLNTAPPLAGSDLIRLEDLQNYVPSGSVSVVTASEPIFVNQSAAALVTSGITSNSVLTLGAFSLGDGGGYRGIFKSTLPAHPGYFICGGRYYEISDAILTPQMFKNYAGSDWTTAVTNCIISSNFLQRPMFIPAGSYIHGPYTFPTNATGLRIYGANQNTVTLIPRDNNQSFIWYIPDNNYCHMFDNIGFSDSARFAAAPVGPPVDYTNVGQCPFILEAAATVVQNIRSQYFKNNIWFREGGYCNIRNLFLNKAVLANMITGGSPRIASTGADPAANPSWQWSENNVENVVIQGLEGINSAAQTIGIDIRSGSAFTYMDRMTGAGMGVGIRIYDSAGFGRGTNPDGIFLQSPNFDYTNSQAIQIIACGLLEIYNSKCRSLFSYSMSAYGFQTLYLKGCGGYSSHLGGLQVGDNADTLGWNMLDINDCHFVGNGYIFPTGTFDAFNVHISTGVGAVRIRSTEMRNRTDSNDVPFGASNLAAYNLVVESAFTGRLDIGAASSVANGRIANTAGIITGSGVLRTNTTIAKDTVGFKQTNSGLSPGVITSSVITIPHGLVTKPGRASCNITGATAASPGYLPRITSVDDTNLYVSVFDGSNAVVTTGSISMYWEAGIV